MRKWILLIVLVFAIGTLVFFLLVQVGTRQLPEDTAVVTTPGQREEIISGEGGDETLGQAPPIDPESPSVSTPEKSIVEVLPEMETYRQEVAENPHEIPPSLVAFSQIMARKMKGALSNPKAGERLFSELDECIGAEENPKPARVVCYMNARRLASKYPKLQENYESLESRYGRDLELGLSS